MSKIDTSSWKDFRIGDLFESASGDTDIQKTHLNGKGVDVVSSGLTNNGIIGKTDVAARIFPAGTLTVDMFGNVYYHNEPYKMVTHARVFSLSLKDKSISMNENIGLYLATSLSFLSIIYSYNDMATFEKIADREIKLPSISKDMPDFVYMASYIEELEQQRIEDLERYLLSTGLDSYDLTYEDKEVLTAHRPMKEFRVGDVLNFDSTRGIYHACNVQIEDEKNDSNHPYIVRTSQNNGMRGYIKADETTLNPEHTISFAQDTAQMFYQAESYFTGNKVKVLSIKEHGLSEKIAQYLIACLNRAFSSFGWGQSYDTKVLTDVIFSLPVRTDANGKALVECGGKYHKEGYLPDFEYMEKYIRAIEKLVIKDVVCFKDNMIKKTKELCEAQKGDTDDEAA